MFLGISVGGIRPHSIVRHKHIKRKRYETHPRTLWHRCGAGVELPWKSVWPPGRAEAAWGRWRCVYRLTYRPSAPLYPERHRKRDRWNLWVLVCLCRCWTVGVIRVAWKSQPIGRPTVTDYSPCNGKVLIFQAKCTRRKCIRKSRGNLNLNCYNSQRNRAGRQEWPV